MVYIYGAIWESQSLSQSLQNVQGQYFERRAYGDTTGELWFLFSNENVGFAVTTENAENLFSRESSTENQSANKGINFGGKKVEKNELRKLTEVLQEEKVRRITQESGGECSRMRYPGVEERASQERFFFPRALCYSSRS